MGLCLDPKEPGGDRHLAEQLASKGMRHQRKKTSLVTVPVSLAQERK